MAADTDTDIGEAFAELRGQLERTRDRLLRELSDGARRREDDEQYMAIAGNAPDPGDASVATEQADLRHAQMGRDVGELRQVESALNRVADGSYGTCAECGQDIPVERLRANPAAERCILCQTARERQYADAGLPSITRRM